MREEKEQEDGQQRDEKKKKKRMVKRRDRRPGHVYEEPKTEAEEQEDGQQNDEKKKKVVKKRDRRPGHVYEEPKTEVVIHPRRPPDLKPKKPSGTNWGNLIKVASSSEWLTEESCSCSCEEAERQWRPLPIEEKYKLFRPNEWEKVQIESRQGEPQIHWCRDGSMMYKVYDLWWTAEWELRTCLLGPRLVTVVPAPRRLWRATGRAASRLARLIGLR